MTGRNVRILALGDVHLGAGAQFGGPDRLYDQVVVLGRIADLARRENVDAILFAGDLAHSPKGRLTPTQESIFRTFVEMVDREIVAIPGNHDRVDSGLSALSIFSAIGNVDVRDSAGITYLVGGVGVACLPWTPPATLVAGQTSVDPDAAATTAEHALVEIARGMFVSMPPVAPRILLAHWSVSGATLPTGLDTGELREVVLPLHELQAIGFDAIVLGHIHKPQLLSGPAGEPPILYTGSPAVCDWGEADSEHGCWILDVAADGSVAATFHPIDDRAFRTLAVAGAPDPSKLASMIPAAWMDGAVVRVRWSGTDDDYARFDQAALRDEMTAAGATVTGIECSIEREDRSRADGLTETAEPEDALLAWLAATACPEEQRGPVIEQHASYLEHLQ